MHKTQVWLLAWEDPTCSGVTEPVCHKYWARAPESRSRDYWSPHALQPALCRERSQRDEKPRHRSEEQPPRATSREEPARSKETTTARNNELHSNMFKKPMLSFRFKAKWIICLYNLIYHYLPIYNLILELKNRQTNKWPRSFKCYWNRTFATTLPLGELERASGKKQNKTRINKCFYPDISWFLFPHNCTKSFPALLFSAFKYNRHDNLRKSY